MPALKDLLEGKPLRSPLHPLLVHLPLAFLPLVSLLDIASWIFARPELLLARGASFALLVGLGTGALASLFGVIDYTNIRNDSPAKKTATVHMLLNVLALGLYAASAGLRYGAEEALRTPVGSLLLALAGLGVLSASGYLGGSLVYDDGVAVGRHRRRTPLPEDTLKPRMTEGGPIAVARAADLQEGATLRVAVGYTVMTLARAEGTVCAFQEFCSHRYGPLSEGCIEGHEIVCPWHRSRFDMRTGVVTAGPAKVDLRVFPVQEKDGKLWVEVPRAQG